PYADCDAEYDEEKVYQYGALIGWAKEVAIANFKQYANSTELNATDVDRTSIMHYSLPAWLFKKGEASKCYVKPNYTISLQDKEFMARVYPKFEEVATRGVTTRTAAQRNGALLNDYKTALQKAGIEKNRVERLTKEFSASLPAN